MIGIDGPRYIILSVEHAEELFPSKPQIAEACAKRLAEFGAVVVQFGRDVLGERSTVFTVLTADNGIDCARRAKGGR